MVNGKTAIADICHGSAFKSLPGSKILAPISSRHSNNFKSKPFTSAMEFPGNREHMIPCFSATDISVQNSHP